MIRLKAIPENIAKLKKCHPNVVVNEIIASVPGTLGEYMIDRLDENIAKQFGTLITPPVTSASQLKPLSQSAQESTQEKPNAAISLWQGLSYTTGTSGSNGPNYQATEGKIISY